MSADIEHVYRYPFASSTESMGATPGLRLSTSGGGAAFPYFFQGTLKRPRQSAQLLRVLSNVVTSRFHIPPAMLKRILATRDPVVTCGGGMLRFEGFSACGSTYARVDFNPDAYEGVVVGQGTTNVDFNAGFRAALSQIRDGERLAMAVGADEVALLRGADQLVERKVPLPVRWLKGFVEVQAYQRRMAPRASLNKVETVRFLRSIPRSTDTRAVYWAMSAGGGLCLSQRETAGAIQIGGIERLRLLDELVPWIDSLRVYADPTSGASGWALRFGPMEFHFVLSPEVWRGFSGEGQALAELAGPQDANLIELARGLLKWQAELRPEEFAANWDVTPEASRQVLAVLGSRGLVGFDLVRSAYFHRELPFDLTLVEELHPRLRDARELVAKGAVAVVRQTESIIEADVSGTDVVHRVRLSDHTNRCTCAWHAKHQGQRGPCKHIIATRIVSRTLDHET